LSQEPFGLLPLSGALLDLGLGLRFGRQSVMTPRDLCGHVHAIGHGLGVCPLGQCQQRQRLMAK
jgi:hypothetical protein